MTAQSPESVAAQLRVRAVAVIARIESLKAHMKRSYEQALAQQDALLEEAFGVLRRIDSGKP